MPTGSGKSGVIAYGARNIHATKKTTVLVLTPRTKITEQLYKECNGSFFKKLDKSIPLEEIPGDCVHLNSDITILDEEIEGKVFFLNIQKLIKIWRVPANTIEEERKLRKKIWKKLISEVGLIIIDEGHYEPANSWSECIRSFTNSAKIIFTATPYRNDLKAFDIKKDYSYFCTYSISKNNGNLRTVAFLPPESRLNYSEFTESVVKNYKELINKKKIHKDAKVIIRCDDFDTIQKIAEIFEKKGESYYAIHEGFLGSDDPKRIKKVPNNIEEDKTIFWIHQYKLMEGVDDPSFQFLCNFQKFKNSRSLVQQVGRVIRIRKNKTEIGYVLENSGGRENAVWDTYLEFDKHIESKPEDMFFEFEKYFAEMLNCHPSFTYVGGGFRKRLELPLIKPDKDLLLPLTCNLYLVKNKIKFKEMKEDIEAVLKENDRLVHGIYEDSLVIVHAGINHSKYLLNHAYLENDLEVIIVYQYGDYVAIYDTGSFAESYLRDNSYISKVDEQKLKKLYKQSKNTLVSNVSLINTNLSPNSIRKKTFTARKISETAISVDDFSQYCSNSFGYSFELNPFSGSNQDEHVKRYVGFTTCKITQDKRFDYSYGEFKFWIRHIIGKIDSDSAQINLFKRYSSEYKPTKISTISNVLLNLSEVETHFNYTPSQDVVFEDICVNVNNSNDFTITISGNTYDCHIEKNQLSDTFKVTSPGLNKDFDPISTDYKNLTSYINKGQLFSLLFNSKSYIYSNGRFFKPEIQVGNNFDKSQFNILDYIEDFAELASIKSEKGTKTVNTNSNWDTGTLFRLIADQGTGTSLSNLFSGSTKYLICDDMGVEVADFILVDNDRVVFIHAKATTSTSDVSASSLQEVCAQATKNLSYLSPFNKIIPTGVKSKWGKEWKANGVTGTVKNRMIVGGAKNHSKAWEDIQIKLKDPNTKKEVWLILGNVLSKNKLEQKLKSSGDYKIALQASLLILSSYQAAYSIGARLRVLCSP